MLGALTVLFGVGLMAAASGELISHAAERPPILTLMVALAVVQPSGSADRCRATTSASAPHDVALRGLARVRTRF